MQITYSSSRFISSTFSEIISVTRIPVAYANSNIALSLVPFKSISFGCSSRSSTSFAVKTLGTLFSIFGDCIFSVGSLLIFPFLTKNWKNDLIDAMFLDIVDDFFPIFSNSDI